MTESVCKRVLLSVFVIVCGFCSLEASLDKMTTSKNLKVSDSEARADRVEKYLSLFKQFSSTLGPAGSWKEGEIEIVLDPVKIKEIEEKCRQRLLMKSGVSEHEAMKWSRVGIIADDGYWMWIRDAVIFPSGAYGTYNRVLWKTSLQAPPGVAVVAVLPNKKIVMNLNFRHATRSWEIELPRGVRKEGETLEQTARRELQEETGYVVDKPIFLGKMTVDSGLATSQVPFYFASVVKQESTDHDDSEAIREILAFSKQEVKEALARGFMELEINGQLVKVPCRDSFLSFAVLVAEAKDLF